MSDAVVVAPVKVRVWQTIGNSFELVLGRLGLFFRVGWLPMLGMLALAIAQAVLLQSLFRQIGGHPPTAGSPPQVGFGWFGFFNVLAIPAQFILLNAFAVRWHRSVVSEDARYWRWRDCGPGFWRFMIYTVAIYVLWIGCLAAGFAIAAGFGLGATPGRPAFGAIGLIFIPLVLFAFCLVRLALIFPSAANARPLSVPEAWRQMRGNTWRLIGSVVLLAIILSVAVIGDRAGRVALVVCVRRFHLGGQG
jgi:hypothetical protein